jgi:anti-sigma-K factor RskA
MSGQDWAALAIVALAVLFLARWFWRWGTNRPTAACGVCKGCGAEAKTLVSIDSSNLQSSQASGRRSGTTR